MHWSLAPLLAFESGAERPGTGPYERDWPVSQPACFPHAVCWAHCCVGCHHPTGILQSLLSSRALWPHCHFDAGPRKSAAAPAALRQRRTHDGLVQQMPPVGAGALLPLQVLSVNAPGSVFGCAACVQHQVSAPEPRIQRVLDVVRAVGTWELLCAQVALQDCLYSHPLHTDCCCLSGAEACFSQDLMLWYLVSTGRHEAHSLQEIRRNCRHVHELRPRTHLGVVCDRLHEPQPDVIVQRSLQKMQCGPHAFHYLIHYF
mmetsp:Transcript_22444/g.49053  ORF Transcript_22444/g.49053 Transcript_22444/m.49053 type:complete len:259 (-) Transcript_22444:375-1151(-)